MRGVQSLPAGACRRCAAFQSARRRISPRRRSAPVFCASSASGTVVGIDLGTSNSAISIVHSGSVQVVSDEEGRSFTPSVVTYTESDTLVGWEAAASAAEHPDSTFYAVKRLIGRQLSEVGHDAQGLRYRVQAGAEQNVQLPCPSRGTVLAPEDVSAVLLQHLIQRAQRQLQSEVSHAVITVPAHFGAQQRAATCHAAKLAGLQGVHLLQEPVAAAIAYGLGKPEDADTMLVLDLGGGTLDVSILESFEGIIEVLSTAGDWRLGGNDFDRLVAQWAVQQLKQLGHARPPDQASMMRQAEAAKVRLSSHTEASLQLASPAQPVVTLPLSRQQFDALSQPLLQRVWQPMQRAGQEVFVHWADRPFSDAAGRHSSSSSSHMAAPADRFAPPPRRITKALLVGGGTRMPAVQQLLAQATGILPDTSLDPELAVVIGAGIQAGILTGQLDSSLEIMDGAFSRQLHSRTSGTSGFQQL